MPTSGTLVHAAPDHGRSPSAYPVSVVVPAYNAGATIDCTLASLRAQSVGAWEAVVVDDGSTDDTVAAVRRHSDHDPRIRLVSLHHRGESAARNAGLALARHDWLLFLDADDWIADTHLAAMTARLAEDTSLDAVHCRHVRVTPDGAEVGSDYVPPEGDLFATLARRAAFPVHACVVRRALVDRVGRFDETLRKSPDWDLWQRIARTGARFGHVPATLAYYRMRPDSASVDGVEMLRDGLVVLRRGHAVDARVRDPHPDHAAGAPPDGVRTQQYYLLSWCAGLMIGQGLDPSPLFDLVGREPFPELYPEAIAQCVFEAVPVSACINPAGWTERWPSAAPRIGAFVTALEHRAQAPGLAVRAVAALDALVREAAPQPPTAPETRA